MTGVELDPTTAAIGTTQAAAAAADAASQPSLRRRPGARVAVTSREVTRSREQASPVAPVRAPG
jgi:hypothetical protein